MGSINAAVPNIRPSLERRATQSCHAKCDGLFASYSVLIRVPFGGETDCDNTFNNLYFGTYYLSNGDVSDGIDVTNWQCVEMNGNTQLWFNGPAENGDGISAALEASYPSVNSFNCPCC
jgi:hypothetical protein